MLIILKKLTLLKPTQGRRTEIKCLLFAASVVGWLFKKTPGVVYISPLKAKVFKGSSKLGQDEALELVHAAPSSNSNAGGLDPGFRKDSLLVTFRCPGLGLN